MMNRATYIISVERLKHLVGIPGPQQIIGVRFAPNAYGVEIDCIGEGLPVCNEGEISQQIELKAGE